MVIKRRQGKNPLLEAAFSDLPHMIDLIPANVYWKDLDLKYQGSNAAMATIAGIQSKDYFIGKDDFEIAKMFNWPDELPISFRKDDEIVIETKRPRLNIEEPVIFFPNGNFIYQLTNKVPIFNDNGEVIGVLGISIDITRIKKLQKELKSSKEKAEEFNELREKFIQNMEHDIRTPLSGMEQTVSVLLDKEDDAFKRQTLEFTLGATEEFKSVINAILNFDHKRYTDPLLNEPFRLSNVFNSVYVMNYLAASAKGLKFQYKVDEKIPSIVVSDQERIKHVLLNLVGNAIKFTNEGEVSFAAKLIKTEDRNVLIEFIIKDTGIGIPEDKRQIIFEKFVRLDPSNRGIYKGTGIGLTNVKEYVEQLGGEVKPIESEKGKGTTITILIPLKASLDQQMTLPSDDEKSKEEDIEFFYDAKTRPKKPELIQPEKAELKQPQKISKKEPKTTLASTQRSSVLLVEDSLVAQHMAKTVIVGLHCDVDIAGSAEDALKMIEEKDYDLIFADIGLPGMDGIEMTRHIRYEERKKGISPTPIVGQSANANTSNKKACIGAGMQDLFPKPLNTKIVTDMLQNYTTQGAQSTPAAFVPPAIKNKHVIDWDIFKSIWKDKASARDVFQDSRLDTFGTIEEFKMAYKAKDWKQLVFLAHKMRGAFIYFGCTRLEEAFSYLEDYLNETKKPDPKIIKSLYDTVLVELRSALDEIEKL